MHTKLGSDNPYGPGRYGFAWQHVPAGGKAHLDYGCGDGHFLASLKGKKIGRLVGLDANRDAVQRAQARSASACEVLHANGDAPLPFEAKTFTSATLMDVLEHVVDQQGILAELHRVLADDGVLVVTVPGRHLLSLLDLGNLKFRFPRLHRWYCCRCHSHAAYALRYAANPDGLVGDISAAKRWHEHFSRAGLQGLLSQRGFVVTEFDGSGYFMRLLKICALLAGRSRRAEAAVERLAAWDARRFESANVFCVAQKRNAS